MSSPAPINSVRARVVKTDAGFVPQISTDSLTWSDMHRTPEADPIDAINTARHFVSVASQLPSVGEVIWRSEP
jgi:hypothetical protein